MRSERNLRRAAIACLCASLLVLLSSVAFGSGPDPAPRTQSELRTCVTDASGFCTVNHSLGVVPDGVQLTADVSGTNTHFDLQTAAGGRTSTTVRVRATTGTNTVYANKTISFWLTVSAPGATVPPTTTTTPPATTTTTVAPPPPGGFPNPASTGIPVGTNLTIFNGDLHATSNVDAMHVTGMIFVEAAGISITRTRVDQSVVNDSGLAFSVTDSDIGPADCSNTGRDFPIGIGYSNYSALRVHLHGHEDGFRAGGPNISIRDSYTLICSPATSNDSDGVQDYPLANHLVIDHNTFDMNHAQGFTAPISVHSTPATGGSADVTITNNLMAGHQDSTYTLNTWPQAGHGPWVITGNRIQDGTWVFGPWSTEGNCQYVDSWSDNDIVTIDPNYQVTATVQDNSPCPA
jgi:hypothetical protein